VGGGKKFRWAAVPVATGCWCIHLRSHEGEKRHFQALVISYIARACAGIPMLKPLSPWMSRSRREFGERVDEELAAGSMHRMSASRASPTTAL
jgi:hypothetical protein